MSRVSGSKVVASLSYFKLLDFSRRNADLTLNSLAYANALRMYCM